MLTYPALLADTAEGKVRLVFPDVPEAVAEAETEEDALYRAKFALELSLGHYLMHGREIPPPSEIPGAPGVSTDKFSLAPTEQLPADALAGGIEADPAPGGGRY